MAARAVESATAAVAGPPSPPAPPAPAPQPNLSGFGRALAARTGCHEPERLTDAEGERCFELIMAAPERRIRETNKHVRVAEHVAVMGKVRRAENTGYRMSCEGLRNLGVGCPNRLPDNLPEDFEPPKD